MAVTSLTRWKGGKPDAIIAAAKKAKAIHEKAGAEYFRLGKIHSGTSTAQWVVAIRHPD